MTVVLDSYEAQLLLEIIEFYTSQNNITAESREANFLIYMLERLKGRRPRRNK